MRHYYTHGRPSISKKSYLRKQEKPAKDRDHHMLSDQDALSALLASADFKDIAVRRLLHGSEILQHHGAGAYGLRQRWQNLTDGLPPLLHAMGSVKPWQATSHPRLLAHPRDYYERNYLELSPYLHVAREYRSLIGDETSWMDIQTLTGKLGSLTALNHPSLKGLFQATVHRIFRRLWGRIVNVVLVHRKSRQSGKDAEARLARLILLLYADLTWALIHEKLDCRVNFIDPWNKAISIERITGCSVATPGSFQSRSRRRWGLAF
jgi:hypothetical protein